MTSSDCHCVRVWTDCPSIVCPDVVASVIVPLPVFFTVNFIPTMPTAVGRVTAKLFAVHSIVEWQLPTLPIVFATMVKAAVI